jgi:hypothetical protein
MRAASTADLAVTVLGVMGLLGFLLAGRMDDTNASPFDIFAFVWFFTLGVIKLNLPWLLKRAAARRPRSYAAHRFQSSESANLGHKSGSRFG